MSVTPATVVASATISPAAAKEELVVDAAKAPHGVILIP